MSKETYYSVKRDLLQRQKRPTTVSKETYYSVKRDLLQDQPSPTASLSPTRTCTCACARTTHSTYFTEGRETVSKDGGEAIRDAGQHAHT